MDAVQLYNADCLDVLRTLPEGSVDSLVTDPPAGVSFMGRDWDNPNTFPLRDRGELPGGSLPKQTPHKHGRGFANGMIYDKNRKARDAFIAFLSAVMSECLRVLKPGAFGLVWALPRTSHWTATALEDAGFEIRDVIHHLFGQGFPKGKSCLKPACENWILVRKPGRMQPLQIDECRIACAEGNPSIQRRRSHNHSETGTMDPNRWVDRRTVETYKRERPEEKLGRWPANLVLDEEAARLLDEQSGTSKSQGGSRGAGGQYGRYGPINAQPQVKPGFGDTGGASRFFYTAKASRRDRGEGNTHPTVKSTKLMEWLVKLITPPGGVVLDPFMGSGSTGKACVLTGRRFVGIEKDADYFAIAQRRITEAGFALPAANRVSNEA